MEYMTTIRKTTPHIYVKRDFMYDEDGRFKLIDKFKLDIFINDKLIYNKYIYFSDFQECKIIGINKCEELKIKPEYIIYDSYRNNEMLKMEKVI